MVRNPRLDSHEVLATANRYRTWLRDFKPRAGDAGGLGWYPYDSFGVFRYLPALLEGGNDYLLDLAGDDPILDAGTGDGDLAFFFESLGCTVHAVDHPHTNYNGMRGIAELKAALGSRVEIFPVDLDSSFDLPAPRYGLSLCLGLLYHLKNPFQLLEILARKSAHSLLSTRIAQTNPERDVDFGRLPIAYLVDPDELNGDATNFWIFTEPGLRRILRRAGWDVCSFVKTDCVEAADPVGKDQRAYCLLRSRVLDPQWRLCLESGWHSLEDASWRWTERRFTVGAYLDRPARFQRVELDFVFPAVQLDRLGPISLGCRVNGVELASQTFASPGPQTYAQPAPAEVRASETVKLEFVLDKAVAPSGADARELGVIVMFVRPGRPVADSNLPLRLITALA